MGAYCELCGERLESWTHANECASGILEDDDAEGRVAALLKENEALRQFVKRCVKDIQRAESICGAQSPGDPNDEDDPPVTCTEPPGHSGKHAGGTRCGTIEWPKEES